MPVNLRDILLLALIPLMIACTEPPLAPRPAADTAPVAAANEPEPAEMAPVEPWKADPALETLSGSVAIDGSSTVYPILAAAALKLHAPGVEVRLGVSGTGGGFKKLCRMVESLRTKRKALEERIDFEDLLETVGRQTTSNSVQQG